ncbi:MAG: MBL fold metallo-hydrolase [Sandaracinaceae bacterium]|jgi:glyoxylase-like metal-dependent hydrolase (beta-lactamase superfamily II)|nr:MBL fold metallo-hydrolase [Sandaracinaceae bacterium]MBK7154714.1 MBL fold metallo-hydrolase [Sandaracinaceae bacterium]MBP7683850.1 MBL fold metallo-hydrolase [Deltaproteobacteria bacterium]
MTAPEDDSPPPPETPTASPVAVTAPKRKRRRWLVAVGVLLALLLAAFAVLFTHAPLPLGAPRGFDLNHVRVIARSGSGPLPTAVGRWVVARSEAPRVFVGASWDVVTRTTFVFPAFQIAWADRYIIVDAPHERSTHDEAFGGGAFDQTAYDGVARALRGAEQILFTHEHLDHVRGVSQSPDFADLAPRVRLTRAQAEAMPADAGFTAAQLAALTSQPLTEPTRVAPGVVLIPAAGHTPGSLYVFVALANGQEVLLVGDTVWSHHNLNRAVGRPLAVSLGLGEDREATLAQARALITLRDAQPTLAIVPAHDDLTVQSYVDAGFLHDGFLPTQPAPAAVPVPAPPAVPSTPAPPGEPAAL